MTNARMIELVIAVALLVAGLVLYRRRAADGSYGSQGAVILFAVAAVMGIHALGGLDYRPTVAEADMFRARAR
jgi:hypothetical protein